MPEQATQKLLVPVDFSDPSVSTVEYAADLASRLSAEVILLYVVEPMMYPSGMGEVVDLDYISLEKELEENGRKTLQKLIDEQLRDTSNPRAVIRKGNAHKEIVSAAGEEGCDMIIIATHGFSGFKHLMLGSVAEKVLRTSTVPVLTLKHD